MKKSLILLIVLLFGVFHAKTKAVNQQPVTITFPFNQGIDGQKASFDSETNAALFKLNFTEYGSALKLYGKNNSQTLFQPKQQDGGTSDINYVDFLIAPKHGMTFTPTRVSLKATRYGTDGGQLNIVWLNSDESTVSLETGVKPNRDNGNPNFSTLSYDIKEAKASDNRCGLRVNIYSLGESKQVGLGDIVIEGTLSGEPVESSQYRPDITISPAEAGTVSILPEGTSFEPGDRIKLRQQRAFGYIFKNWTDENGNVLSKDDELTINIKNSIAHITANYTKLNIYELQLNIEGAASGMVQVSPTPTIIDGRLMLEEGVMARLTATNNDLYTFTHWSNGESTNELTLGMTQDKQITAYYSAIDFIAAWDFQEAGNKGNQANYANSENTGTTLVLRDADGNSVDWTVHYVQNRYAAVNGHSDKPLGYYYFQTKFNSKGYKDIKVYTGMSYNANTCKDHVLEYALDGQNWTKVTTFSPTSRSRWKTGTYNLPAETADKAEVWLRWKGDTASGTTGTPAGDSDGAVLTSTTIYGTAIYTDDGLAPQLIETIPTKDAVEIPCNGKIILKFNEQVTTLADAKATLTDKLLSPIVTAKTILFEYKDLDYNTNYTFTLPGNVISDRDGHTLTDTITISFRTQGQPKIIKRLYDFVVPDDGDIKEALTVALKREDTSVRFRIFIKDGVHKLPATGTKHYRHTNGKSGDEEVVNFEGDYPDPITYVTGGNISFIGESRDGAIITNDIPEDATFPSQYGRTSIYDGIGQGDVLQISGQNYYFQDITVKSGIDDALGRNLAIQDKAQKTIYKNVCLWGYQDTWTSNNSGPYYFEGGVIRGRTDYMCGKGDAYFNGVTLRQMKGGYAAVPSQPAKIGWIYKDCTIVGDEEGVDGNYTLGRPWGSGTPIALFIDTRMEVKPSAIGWSEMSGGWPKRFAEFHSMTASGNEIELSNRKTTFADNHVNNPVLTAEEAAEAADMQKMFGGWGPTQLTQQAPLPTNVKLEDSKLTWDDNNYVLCWAISKNGKIVSFTTQPMYTIDDTTATYAVRASNEMGGLGDAIAANSGTNIKTLNAKCCQSDGIYTLHGVRVNKTGKGIYIINGRKVVK